MGPPKKHMRKKRLLWLILLLIVFIACLFCVTYPLISNYLYDMQNSELIAIYDDSISEIQKEQGFEEELAACDSYNQILASHLVMEDENRDYFNEYEERLNFDGSGMMGYLTIPKLDLMIPLYHGTEDHTLEIGLGHMEFTSLPVGGKSTHAVLTGHTGVANKRLLTDLDQMENGDLFTFRVCDELLTYQVDQIKTVLPEEYQDLRIVPGKDYMTLVTCTPYGVNSHRLLVRGCRVQNEAVEEIEEQMESLESDRKSSTWLRNYMKALGIGAVIFTAVLLFAWIFRKLRQKNGE